MRLIGKALAGALMTCVLAGYASQATAATIANGSFNSPIDPGSFITVYTNDNTTIPGWTVDKGNVDYIGTYWPAQDGGRSIDLNGLTPATISTVITDLKFGQQYTISFWMAANPDGGNVEKTLDLLIADIGGASFKFSTVGDRTNMGWAQYFFTFTANALNGEMKLSFASTTGGDNYPFGPALSHIEIAETPLPAALPLFMTGVGLMGAAAWRRRKKEKKLALA
jgi:choice-of-anchor C domain-containing protein